MVVCAFCALCQSPYVFFSALLPVNLSYLRCFWVSILLQHPNGCRNDVTPPQVVPRVHEELYFFRLRTMQEHQIGNRASSPAVPLLNRKMHKGKSNSPMVSGHTSGQAFLGPDSLRLLDPLVVIRGHVCVYAASVALLLHFSSPCAHP